MNKKILYVFAFLLTLSLVSAATTTGKIGVNTGSGQVVISCEDWSGSGWGTCITGVQTFICFNKNSYFCNTNNIRPAQCGNTKPCAVETTPAPVNPSGGGGGGGGGGSSGGGSSGGGSVALSSGSCVENWQCGNWSNSDNQCGTRTCIDSNKCGTADLKPVILKECSSTGFLGITGAAIGSFAKSGEGIATFSGLIILIALTITITSIKRKKSTNPKSS